MSTFGSGRSSSQNQGDIDVFQLKLADRQWTPLATTQGALAHEESPCWSPDGKRFAFTSTRHGNQQLYVADITGGEWRRLTEDPAINAHPAWSLGGKMIAFATNRSGDLEIALNNPDGSNLRRLTESRGLDDFGQARRRCHRHRVVFSLSYRLLTATRL